MINNWHFPLFRHRLSIQQKFVILIFLTLTLCSHFQPLAANASTVKILEQKESIGQKCFLIMAGKKYSNDGSILICHCEDWDSDSVRLQYIPRQTNTKKEVDVNYVTIPQVSETLAYWAQGYSSEVSEKKKNGDWILNGMNEHGLVITCNIADSKVKQLSKGKGITRYAIRKLVLEQATTANEGVKLIGRLIETFGLNGRSLVFCIADTNEIWYMVITPRHWVAKKVPDDGYIAAGNCFIIDNDWDLASKGVINYAQEQGWYDPAKEKFSFRKAYAETKQLKSEFNVSRAYQAEEVLPSKKGNLDVWDLWKIAGLAPIMNEENQATFIWRLRSDVPVGLGCMMWFGYCGAGINAMAPIYMANHDIPKPYADSKIEYDKNDAWWQFRLLKKCFYPSTWDFSDEYPKHNAKLHQFQEQIFTQTKKIEKKAEELYKRGNNEKAAMLLNSYSNEELLRILNFTNQEIEKKNYIWIW